MAGMMLPVQLQRVLTYVADHLFKPVFTTEAAKLSGWCPEHLNRMFHKFLGCSFRDYVMQCKLREADAMFLSAVRVKEVARSLCLCPRTLERRYEALYGITPQERRQGGMLRCRGKAKIDAKDT